MSWNSFDIEGEPDAMLDILIERNNLGVCVMKKAQHVKRIVTDEEVIQNIDEIISPHALIWHKEVLAIGELIYPFSVDFKYEPKNRL